MQISFFLARRYVKKHGHTTLIYRLSRLSCYSMALGSAILVLILSTMNGMEKVLSNLFDTYTPALKIEPKIGQTFICDAELKGHIINLSGVADIVEVLEATALVRLHRQQAIVTFKGVSNNFTASDFYRNATWMDGVTFLRDGSPQAIAGILIGQFLQWTPHSNRVEVFYPKQGGYLLCKPYKRMTLAVHGLFSIARKIDGQYIIAPMDFVEALTGGRHQRTHWEVVLEETADLATIQARIQQVLPDGYSVTHRDEQNVPRRRAIFIERLSVCFIFALVLLLAALHIFFMLCMLIVHKQKDIAMLAALGATPGQIGKLICYNGLLVSLEGMLYGLIIGWGLGFLQQKFGIITLTRVRSRIPYPIEMHGVDCLYTAMITTVFSMLATLWPVKCAMQLARKSLRGTSLIER
ncbi:FtsX-like permease family [Cardinium endosymbiont of Sogatella furcifera]|uniref:ABC transporter permease n=1 Tax=Cardinium endosymbiont of Sogatella furcifera TaxID=650378 RepID=UPI000E0D083C|nr:FtsX-like permease family protein [Cardinium endosymbiont of Sogatella furcifera]AXI24443.1 FtsX-like permease family [Cardinium endosymbiont of Sogatella furcifera]